MSNKNMKGEWHDGTRIDLLAVRVSFEFKYCSGKTPLYFTLGGEKTCDRSPELSMLALTFQSVPTTANGK